ncbi:MAG: ABC transporter ATP-binding protein, partial [Gammaproteobacteria bacterium]
PSGCGKSTLLYLIAGLEVPSAGSIEAHGVAVTQPDSDRSLIFQESSLYPWLSVAENVTFGLKLRGMPKAQRRQVAGEYLSKVGLGDMLDKRPDELSGGMRQRVAVARALAMRPSVLLMDEPFAALDVQTRSKLQDFLIQVWRDSAAAVVFVTHHIDEALALADRIVVITARPGRIKNIVDVDLKRPRDPRDSRFHDLRDHLVDLLADEVDRAFAEQEQVRA